jgi:hypothetical protein
LNPSIESPTNEQELREYLKVHRVTQGIKFSEPAIKHIMHLINLFIKQYDMQKIEIAIVFYAMGYITGKLEN